MQVDVKTLASLLSVSPRTIQKWISAGTVEAVKINQKSYLVETESLPEKWAKMLPSDKSEKSIVSISSIQKDVRKDVTSPTAIAGRSLSGKEKRCYEIYQHWLSQKAIYSNEAQRIEATARWFGVSASTVRRMISRVQSGGLITAERKVSSANAWDPEAEAYLKSYYLQLLRDRNINSKIAAFKAVKEMAAVNGWKTGCRASAYNLLSSIPSLLLEYATGGNRALDNIFYIKRNWSNLKPAQILIGDQHRVDFWVKEKKADGSYRYYRPEFYVWEDAASRCVAGIAVAENYSSDTVKEALYMAIRRFGLFDCTYNDNGSSECSSAVTQIIDEIIALSGGKSRMMDISELYRTKENLFVIEDAEGNIIDTASDARTWRAKHRRIYANVKNAKTKPIERLFNTLETKLAQKGIPGHVVNPSAPAHVEEKESLVLERQKDRDEILTLDEFILALIQVIDDYEHTVHSSLNTSPVSFVERCIEAGWRAQLPENLADLDFIFLERRKVKVTKGRVTINRIQYMGEDLRTDERGNLEDVGLHLYEGEKVEVRFDPLSQERAYAVIPASATPVRALYRVESIEMLDEEAMNERIQWKRRSMRVVRQAFRAVAYPDSEAFQTSIADQVIAADKPILEKEEKDAAECIRRLVNPPEEQPARPKNVLHFFASDAEHFRWCLEELIAGRQLTEKELSFVQSYRTSEEYSQDKDYWATYERFGGLL